jgi:hypothetical protein
MYADMPNKRGALCTYALLCVQFDSTRVKPQLADIASHIVHFSVVAGRHCHGAAGKVRTPGLALLDTHDSHTWERTV